MPLRLWQEVQILPWSTEIVALTCGTRKRLRPVVPAQARQACCATPVQNQKVGQLPPLSSFIFLTLREAGRPFVGPAGTALRDMLREAGIDESQIRLANALPFRPIERSAKRGLHNRRPTEKELRDYGPFVLADIATVRPKLIVALGKSAASLFGASTAINSARRQVFWFQHIPVRITYHPGFVLRFGGRGSQLWRTAVRDLRTYWKLERSSSPTPVP